MKVLFDGHPVEYEFLVAIMDDALREELHRELAPCSAQTFIDAYDVRHFEKYGKLFAA